MKWQVLPVGHYSQDQRGNTAQGGNPHLLREAYETRKHTLDG
jgi:hypothetical protein